jgi:ABC-2 type transport system ATP-binding protein
VTAAPAPGSAAPAAAAATAKTAPASPASPSKAAPAKRPTPRSTAARPASVKRTAPTAPEIALSVTGLTKTFGDRVAVDDIQLSVTAGSFFGFVGPNGAGKTTTLSMVTGLLRPDAGIVKIYGVDVWENAALAKRSLGVLPDRLRLFDRLTGSEFLHHAGALRGLDRQTIIRRVADLERAFGIEHSAKRLVSDYSAGMVKKIAIAAAMIHSPRLLVLDEPFESVDPVSAEVVIDILKKFAAAGGTVVLSSHSMDLIERVCDAVAIIADGRVLASGPIDEVLAGQSLESRFVELAGGATAVEGMEWLQSFSD